MVQLHHIVPVAYQYRFFKLRQIQDTVMAKRASHYKVVNGQKIEEGWMSEITGIVADKVTFQEAMDAIFYGQAVAVSAPPTAIVGESVIALYEYYDFHACDLSMLLVNSRMMFSLYKTFPGHFMTETSGERDRKSTRLNSSHLKLSRMPSSA